MPTPTAKSPKKRAKAETTVTREEFRRDPRGVFKRIIGGGRVVITDSSGLPVAVISSPTERIEITRA